MDVGELVGTADGIVLGVAVGKHVWNMLGVVDGVVLGTRVGTVVGTNEGVFVGALEYVGIMVGEALVGLLDGATVGATEVVYNPRTTL